MKIKFNMPVELQKLPEAGTVSYSVKTMWRLADGALINKSYVLKLDFFGDGYTEEIVRELSDAIIRANRGSIESPILESNVAVDFDDFVPSFSLTFLKREHFTDDQGAPLQKEGEALPSLDGVEWGEEGIG